LPEIALAPDQVPAAEQEVALVADQVSVEDPPLATDVGFAPRDTVGAGGGGVAPPGSGVAGPPQAASARESRAARRNVFVRDIGPFLERVSERLFATASIPTALPRVIIEGFAGFRHLPGRWATYDVAANLDPRSYWVVPGSQIPVLDNWASLLRYHLIKYVSFDDRPPNAARTYHNKCTNALRK
jgi:hypothetical protein